MKVKHLRKNSGYTRPIATSFVLLALAGNTKAEMANIPGEKSSLFSVNENVLSIKGIVVSEKGEPIIGASVVENGTTNGTVTDYDGKFTLNAPAGALIRISYIGYKTQDLIASVNMKIVLKEDTEVLDEVVVMGYGAQKKKLVTGSTVQVKGEDIAKLNTVNPIEAIQSQAPGVNIIQKSGFLGSAFKVTIRGMGSNTNSSPLYVIDGVANSSLDGLNPNDIESIDVLKDGATAAIYGARAANGVILVTTKQGKAGKVQISYDGYMGWQNIYKMPTILTAPEYMAIQNESRIMDGLTPYNWATYLPERDLTAIKDGTWKGTNWLKESLNKDAPIQNHSLNFTGGNDMSTFAIGLSFTGQEATIGTPGAMPDMKRYNGRVNSNHILFKKDGFDLFRIGQTMNYKYQEMRGSMATDGIYWNSMHNLLIMSPLMHPYNSSGGYYMWEDQVADGYKWDTSNNANKNPIAYTDYMMNQNKSRSHYLQSSVYLNLQPIKDLNIKTQFGYIMGASSYRSYIPSYDKLTATLGGDSDKVSQSLSVYNRWSWENTANYIFKIKEHNFDALIGMSLEKWGMGEQMSGSNRESVFYDFEHAYLSNVPGKNTIESLTGGPFTPGSLASIFGRINYNYMEKYMASFIMRADGSSNFARGHRWGYFPSVSLGWTVTSEEFMKDITWLEFLKLRGSYGQNGNSAIPEYQYLATILTNNGYGGYPIGGGMGDAASGSYAGRLSNPDLKWETQTSANVGVDARFLQGRLGLVLDWYDRRTKDWLVQVPLLSNIGVGAVYKNAGAVKNTGFEASLNWKDDIAGFTYGANLSVGYNKNKVTQLNNSEKKIWGDKSVFWEGQDPCYMLEVGKPMGYFFGYVSDGIFQNQQQIDNYEGALLNGSKTAPGDVIWRDVNNDGVIDANDRTDIGNPHPDVTIGFSVNLGWKGFDLGVTTYAALGHQIMKCYRDFSSSPLNNYTTDIYQRWHGEGTSNKYPRLSSASSSNWNRTSSIYVEDGDFWKIKNVTLGYDFKKTFRKIPFNTLRVYFTAQNLFTITGYSGMDPEVGYGSSSGWASGLDMGFYPSARTFMFGVNVNL